MANEPVKTPVFSLLTLRDTRSCFADSRRYAATASRCSVGRDRIDERMLRREDEVRRAENRVRTRREHSYVDRLGDELVALPAARSSPCRQAPRDPERESDLRAIGAADPVSLRLFRRFGPVDRRRGCASRRPAYSVMRKNHCSRTRCSTLAPHRSHSPAMTCSLASTVLSIGHQLTAAAFLYASPRL